MEDFIPTKNVDVRRKQGLSADYDFKGAMLVASVWLLFYVVMLSGLLGNQGRESLASIGTLVPH
jgi:hypothetical protein